MSALMRRRSADPVLVEFTLGRSSLADVAGTVMKLLRDPEQTIVVSVTGFDYFDENDLTAISDMATWSPRLRITGLDAFVDTLLPAPAAIDVRSTVERAVTHLSNVTVVTAIADGQPLDDHELDEALRLATSAGRSILTVDLRHLEQLSPAQVLTIAEISADLHRELRTLILVNTTSAVSDQLRTGGLSGALRMSADNLA